VLKGVGFLYKRNGVNIQPLIYGAQENGIRGGTENTFGIIGLSEAIKYCDISQKKIDETHKKRNYFLELFENKFDCELNGDSYCRLPNNINVTFPQNITGEALLYTLDLSGIQIGVGSACNSHSIEHSYVLKAIGLNDEQAMRSIRITFSDDITYEEIDMVIDELEKTIKIIEI
jgi:cysteine desulfurase